jgi:hypothetical protein
VHLNSIKGSTSVGYVGPGGPHYEDEGEATPVDKYLDKTLCCLCQFPISLGLDPQHMFTPLGALVFKVLGFLSPVTKESFFKLKKLVGRLMLEAQESWLCCWIFFPQVQQIGCDHLPL